MSTNIRPMFLSFSCVSQIQGRNHNYAILRPNLDERATFNCLNDTHCHQVTVNPLSFFVRNAPHNGVPANSHRFGLYLVSCAWTNLLSYEVQTKSAVFGSSLVFTTPT